jgi:site-specific recombinase XerD
VASLQERNGSFRVLFTFNGKLHAFTLGKVDRDEAETKAAQVAYLLLRLKQRLLTLPDGADIVTFLKHDGKPPEGPTLPSAPRQAATVSYLKDRYVATLGNGTVEANSLETCTLHLSHCCRFFGDTCPLGDLSHARLQEYVNHRARKGASPVTIRKEIATLRAAWNWGGPMKLTEGIFPSKGLRYPKGDEKPPFMTRDEIERQIAAGADAAKLWEALYLQAGELAEFLAHVQGRAAHGWVYPLLAFAAHTGARRSEMLRALVADVDFVANVVTIREKKRVRGERTTRRVPLTPFLRGVLEAWPAEHPGGPYLFCHAGTVARSKKRSRTTGHQNQKVRPSGLKERQAAVKARQRGGAFSLTGPPAAVIVVPPSSGQGAREGAAVNPVRGRLLVDTSRQVRVGAAPQAEPSRTCREAHSHHAEAKHRSTASVALNRSTGSVPMPWSLTPASPAGP